MIVSSPVLAATRHHSGFVGLPGTETWHQLRPARNTWHDYARYGERPTETNSFARSQDGSHYQRVDSYDVVNNGQIVGRDPDPNIRFPQYKAYVGPDIHFIGFDLSVEEVRGDPALDETAQAKASIPANKLGWFFALKEMVGEPRFGLDDGLPDAPEPSNHKCSRRIALRWLRSRAAGARFNIKPP